MGGQLRSMEGFRVVNECISTEDEEDNDDAKCTTITPSYVCMYA